MASSYSGTGLSGGGGAALPSGDYNYQSTPAAHSLTGAVYSSGNVKSYLMRGKNTLSAYVYWVSMMADGNAIDYSGGNTPLTDICIFKSFE
jgi:hypothetical protein